jgi:hypothetical protein
MKRSIFAVFLASTLVSACQSEMPAKGEELSKLKAQCETYGFAPGSSQYAACLLELDQTRINRNIDRRKAFGAALSGIGNGMQAANRNRITCNTSPIGRSYTTRCY